VQAASAERAMPLLGPYEVRNLSITDETGAKLVESVDLTIAPGERVAAIGDVNAGAETVAEAIVRLQTPSSGRIRIGDMALDDLGEAQTGRRIAFAGPDPYLRNTSLRDALLFGLKYHPAAATKGPVDARRAAFLVEAQMSGNSHLDSLADWVDYEGAGVANDDAMTSHIIEMLRVVEMDDSVFELGLRSRLDPAALDHLGPRLLAARQALGHRLAEKELAGLVEPFDASAYNSEATIGENLLFGAALDPAFASNALARQPYVASVLTQTKLDAELVVIGRSIAQTLTELFADLPADDSLYQELGLMKAEELPVYQAILTRNVATASGRVQAADRAALISLALGYCEPRHRLSLMTPALAEHVVRTRQRLMADPPASLQRAVAFYRAEEFNAGSTLEDNILFGRTVYGRADGPRRVGEALRAVIRDLDLSGTVLEAGLGFSVGAGGRRLSAAERQKVSLARALLKRPDLLVISRGLGALGARSQQAIVDRVLTLAQGVDGKPGFAVYWVLSTPALAKMFDRVVVFHDGKVAEQGAPAELAAAGGRYRSLAG
jgi:putative ABC transport system ATP-binding protein